MLLLPGVSRSPSDAGLRGREREMRVADPLERNRGNAEGDDERESGALMRERGRDAYENEPRMSLKCCFPPVAI